MMNKKYQADVMIQNELVMIIKYNKLSKNNR